MSEQEMEKGLDYGDGNNFLGRILDIFESFKKDLTLEKMSIFMKRAFLISSPHASSSYQQWKNSQGQPSSFAIACSNAAVAKAKVDH